MATKYEKTTAQRRAEEALERHSAQKPAAYSSQWEDKRRQWAQALEDRKSFTYDAASDALYQQLKGQYVRQGRQAMLDTLGQAATLTGGYGNSYGQTAAQQTYQGYLQQLTDRIPQLQEMALQRYNAESQRLSDQYNLYSDLENQDYGRYQEALGAYYDQLERLQENARYQQDFGYNAYRDQLADQRAHEEFAYRQQRDQVKDQQWQAQFDEDKRRYDLENAPVESPAYGYEAPPQQQEQLSQAGEDFLKNLPYAPGGTSPAAWKKLVSQRLQGALNAGKLTDVDARLLKAQLGL